MYNKIYLYILLLHMPKVLYYIYVFMYEAWLKESMPHMSSMCLFDFFLRMITVLFYLITLSNDPP